MRRVTASQFRAKCYGLLNHIPPEGIVITKRGVRVAVVMPIETDASVSETGGTGAELIGSMRDSICVHGDLLSTGLSWESAN